MSQTQTGKTNITGITCWKCEEYVDLTPREQFYVTKCKCGTIDVSVNPEDTDPTDHLASELCTRCHDVVAIHKMHDTSTDERTYYGCRCGNHKGEKYSNPYREQVES